MAETGTVRTEEELMTIFREGQPSNSITSQDMRDFVKSVPSLAIGGTAMVVNTEMAFTSTPGGTLTGGSTNVVTLTPVPRGINGNDIGHYVLISGGTGPAEAVLITGGTAVSEGASGTISFVPASSHTGEWTITSASGGIQEAVNYAAVTGVKAVAVAAGEYSVSPITVQANMMVSGVGWGTILKPRTANGRIFQMDNPGIQNFYDGTGQANLILRDMQVSARGLGINTAVGFYFRGLTNVTLENILFDDINHGAFFDKCCIVRVNHCPMQDNTTIFIGSTTSTQPFHSSADFRITGVSYKTTTMDTANLTMGRKILHIQGAVAGRITDFSCAALHFRAYGISIEAWSEDIMISNASILQGINNIQILGATVDGLAGHPVSVSIIGGAIAAYGTRAIYIAKGGLFLVQGVDLTGAFFDTGTEVAAIEVGTAGAAFGETAGGISILGCRFMLALDGHSILVNENTDHVLIANNFFRQSSLLHEVKVTGDVIGGLTITSNIRSAYCLSPAFLDNANTRPDQCIHGNVGIDDKGQQIINNPAASIEFKAAVVSIGGSGTFTTIAPPAHYTDTVLVAPQVGSDWLMTAAGNIANPPATHPGIPFQMRFVENAAGGPKWFVIGLGGIVP